MENQEQKSSTSMNKPSGSMKPVIITVVIALILLLGLYFVVKNKSSMNKSSLTIPSVTVNQPSPVPTALPTLGTVSISTLQAQSRVGQVVPVVVKGDSQGKDVVGFDILITYDPAAMTVGQITPLNKSYSISSYTKRKGEISVTGTKSPGGQTSNDLVNAALLNITFTPLKVGATTVDLKAEINNERTKFVDGKNLKYAPALQSLNLDIL